MQLDDDDKKEDNERKLVEKLKTAMDNSKYAENTVYRATVIDTVFYFMKCVAYITNLFIWYKHGPQNPGLDFFKALLASHGLEGQGDVSSDWAVLPHHEAAPARDKAGVRV